jgi:hypothetical protein
VLGDMTVSEQYPMSLSTFLSSHLPLCCCQCRSKDVGDLCTIDVSTVMKFASRRPQVLSHSRTARSVYLKIWVCRKCGEAVNSTEGDIDN